MTSPTNARRTTPAVCFMLLNSFLWKKWSHMINSILNPFNYIKKNHLCMRSDMPLVSFFRESKSVQIMRSLMTWRTTSLMVRCALIIAMDPVTLSVYTSNFSLHTGVTCFIYIWAWMDMVRKSMHNHIMVTL